MEQQRFRTSEQGASLPIEQPRRHPRIETIATWMALALQELAPPMVIFYRNRLLSEEAIFHAVAKALSIWSSNPGCFCSALHLLNWLKIVAFRTMVDWHRKGQRYPHQSLPTEDGSEFPDHRSPSRPPQRWTAEDKQAVWVCLQELPSAERAILEGHYYEKLTDGELAKRLFRKRTASPALVLRVWRQRQKALAHLRQLLQQQGVGSEA